MSTAKLLWSSALAATLSLACASSSAAVPREQWLASWACSPQIVEPANRPPEPGLAGNTLRQVVHLSVGGSRIRLRLSNEFGAQAMTLDAVHVALPVASTAAMTKGAPGSGAEGLIPTTSAIQPATDHMVTFSGKPTITVQPGSPVLSDPIDFPVAAFADLAVTLVATGMPDQLSGHPGSRQTSFLATGNQVAAASFDKPVPTDHWYFLDGVDVANGSSAGGAIVALGDSITDGRGSITNGNTRWSDFLSRRLAADKRTANTSVLDEGLGGNCILHGGLGPTALSRFDRDVLGQTGVRWVVIFEGVNDIGGAGRGAAQGQPAQVGDQIIFALQQFIRRAHAHGLLAYGATITPFGGGGYGTAVNEAERTKVNEWIRTSGQYDGFADFDKAVRDPAHPGQLDPAADSGDHLHLSSEGYKRLAGAFDLQLFTR